MLARSAAKILKPNLRRCDGGDTGKYLFEQYVLFVLLSVFLFFDCIFQTGFLGEGLTQKKEIGNAEKLVSRKK